MAALSGQRHGTASEQVTAYVRALRGPSAARAAVAESLRGKSAIPRFGPPHYPQGDPRAAALLALAREARPTATRRFEALAAAVHSATGDYPTSTWGWRRGSLRWSCPMAPPAIFAVGRTAGLIGHILEQRADGRLLRPRAQYFGA